MAKRKGANVKIEFFGFNELLDKIEKAGHSVDDAIMKAAKKSAQPIIDDMIDFVERHSYGGPDVSPWASKRRETLNSWQDELQKKGDVITYKFGFGIKQGGLPAVFLNYGGFYTKPYLFIDRAVDEHIDDVKRIQEETLKQILRELQ